jgi:plasmid maintenance system killer protein
MEVLFINAKLANRLQDGRHREQEFGTLGAGRIDLRLQQLHSAPTLEDARNLPGRCQELTTDHQDSLAIDIHPSHRLIFEPTHPHRCRTSDGGLDWSAVESITITDITDSH